MQDNNYTIRTMTRPEVDIAVEWAAEEGWNPGFNDADCYYCADPNGFLIGLLGDRPVATISAVRYDGRFGFLGFYIVKPEYRGKGYGMRIWNAALEYLAGCNMALDGVVAQQENYRKSGFKLAYRNVRYAGHGGGTLPADMEIVPLSTLPFDEVESYGRPFFPAERTAFTKCWIEQPQGRAMGVMDGGRLAGYGVIRRCRSGYKVGPLFADIPELADALFLALKADIGPEEPVFLDVPEVNREAVALAERHSMEVSFETARMYTGAEPDIPLNRLYGVASFEIG